jgi:hypothetical protein
MSPSHTDQPPDGDRRARSRAGARPSASRCHYGHAPLLVGPDEQDELLDRSCRPTTWWSVITYIAAPAGSRCRRAEMELLELPVVRALIRPRADPRRHS